MTTTSEQGSMTEGMVMAALIRQGYSVSLPFGGALRYDMIFDDGESLHRVQCKTARIVQGAVRFSTASCQRDTRVRSDYRGQVEFFGVYCPANDKVYLVPIGDTPVTECALRITPSANNQTKGVRWATDYEVV